MHRSTNKRCSDLRDALQKGHHSNGNHAITAGEGVVQKVEWCQACPESMRCFLVGREIDVQEAINKHYPCIKQQRFFFFRYHGACCLTFDQHEMKMNDWGYWGYSITTSRAIRWYIEALADNCLINYVLVEPAIAFFKKRKNDVASDDHNLPWFSCR